MLTYQDLLDIGLSPDAETLQARLIVAVGTLGFALSGGTLVRGRLASRRASVHGFGNHSAEFIEASRSLDVGLRDPLLTAMLAQPGCHFYDQASYAQAGAGELWEHQAAFGYRSGLAISLHERSHAEVFCFGVDGADVIEPGQRLMLEGNLRVIALHAHSAAKRLHTGIPSVDMNALGDEEIEALKWAAEAQSVWLRPDGMTVITNHDRQFAERNAREKLGASTTSMAVLRAIEGGLIDR